MRSHNQGEHAMKHTTKRQPWPLAVVKMIERKQGASIAELMKARGWQAHSVRAAISTLRKQAGLQIESLRDPRRGRVYRLVRPGAQGGDR